MTRLMREYTSQQIAKLAKTVRRRRRTVKRLLRARRQLEMIVDEYSAQGEDNRLEYSACIAASIVLDAAINDLAPYNTPLPTPQGWHDAITTTSH